ncbi:putative reverse transcriptase domain-containing protein [Tanacetum coccineum]
METLSLWNQIVFTDYKSLQHILDQKELNMRQHRWLELLSDYDCDIRYHPGKANVVVDAFESRYGKGLKRLRRWKWIIFYDGFISLKLPKSSSGFDTIWVDYGSAYKSVTLAIYRRIDPLDKLVRLYLNKIVARHGIPASIICDHDGRFTSNFWKSFQKALGTDISVSTAYHPKTDGQSERTIQTLEDCKCLPC